MTDKLPELTDDERQALDNIGAAEILGTWEERYRGAVLAAMRYMRENRRLREENDRLQAELWIDGGFPFGGNGR